MTLPIHLDRERIDEFCRAHHITVLSVFGSVLRNDFRKDSDIDILVEFEKGHTPGFGFFTIAHELSDLLGKPVDLNTPQSLSTYFRDSVLAESYPIYAEGNCCA